MLLRRLWLLGLVSVVAAAGASSAAPSAPLLRFGVVTDVHSADVDTSGARTYRASADKLAACVRVMNGQRVALLVELGDFKDQDKAPVESRTLQYLRDIEHVFAGFNGPRYHVLGNHDTDSVSKGQFLEAVVNTGIAPDAARYTFVQRGIRFVVLDAGFNADGTPYDHGNFNWEVSLIDPPQLAWLEATLAASAEPIIVLVHQQLDGADAYSVRNAPDVRAALERSGKVIAVLQGHRHEGAFSMISGVPYMTFRGLVQGPPLPDNAFSIVEVQADLGVRVTGYGRAESREFRADAARRLSGK